MDYVVVSLSKNRLDSMDSWITCVYNQSLKPKKIVIGLDEKDYEDSGENLKIYYHDIPIEFIKTTSTMGWDRTKTNQDALKSSESMALLRDYITGYAFGYGYDCVVNCDSDVIPAFNALEMLVEDIENKGVVCAPVLNSPDIYDVFLNFDKKGNHYNRLNISHLDTGYVPCASGGALVAIHKLIWEQCEGYKPHPQCENVGFGESVNHLVCDGYWCNTNVRSIHLRPEWAPGLVSHII